MLALAACGEGTTEPPADLIEILTRPAQTDTVGAVPVQALIVAVRNQTGSALAGSSVEFRGLPVDPQHLSLNLLVRVPGDPVYKGVLATTTDARGQALVLLQFGETAGSARIVITVPELGKSDTVAFVVLPGAPASVRATPRDTAAHAAVPVQLHGTALDRFDNPVASTLSWQLASSLPANAVSVSPTGLLLGATPARAIIRVGTGALRDSVLVSILPPGIFLAGSALPLGILLSDLDGSGRRLLQPGPFSEFVEASWSPTGTEVALAPTAFPAKIDLIGLNGTQSAISWTPTGIEPYWPAFSRDGQFVYFTGVSSGNAAGIYRVRRDGTGLEAMIVCNCYRPSLSPDGRYLTYHGLNLAQEVVVRVLDLVTRTAVGAEVRGRFPEWSPAGNTIAFLENDTGRIRVMNADGSNLRYLTLGPEFYVDQQLSWSPDGAWLLARSGENLDVIELATGLILPVPGSAGLIQPAWKP